MVRRRDPENRLLVEGKTEQRLIPELVEAVGIPWGERRSEAIVDIEECNGIESMLDPGVIELYLDASRLRRLGIIADGDPPGSPQDTYNRVRARCMSRFPTLPQTLPAGGAIAQAAGKRIGIWVMPDNRNHGMLETFLTEIVPDPTLLEYADEVTAEAARRGAPFKAAHVDKARIHTWLAWQSPPGLQLHDAVKQRMFDADAALGGTFVAWLEELFELNRQGARSA